jgi:hypothetical protein
MQRLVVPLAFVLALSATALAQSPNSNRNQRNSPPAQQTISVTFGATVERDIRAYFQANPLAPQSLPPGIAKNVARGKALPPGIAKRALPGPLVSRLPAYPDHELVIVDRDVMLVNIATQVIVDILTRVL